MHCVRIHRRAFTVHETRLASEFSRPLPRFGERQLPAEDLTGLYPARLARARPKPSLAPANLNLLTWEARGVFPVRREALRRLAKTQASNQRLSKRHLERRQSVGHSSTGSRQTTVLLDSSHREPRDESSRPAHARHVPRTSTTALRILKFTDDTSCVSFVCVSPACSSPTEPQVSQSKNTAAWP